MEYMEYHCAVDADDDKGNNNDTDDNDKNNDGHDKFDMKWF